MKELRFLVKATVLFNYICDVARDSAIRYIKSNK